MSDFAVQHPLRSCNLIKFCPRSHISLMHCKIQWSKINANSAHLHTKVCSYSEFLATYNDDHGKYYYAASSVWFYWKIRFIVKCGDIPNVSWKINGGLNVDFVSGIEQLFAIWDKLSNGYLVWTQYLFFPRERRGRRRVNKRNNASVLPLIINQTDDDWSERKTWTVG